MSNRWAGPIISLLKKYKVKESEAQQIVSQNYVQMQLSEVNN